jgi:hypothetical protein
MPALPATELLLDAALDYAARGWQVFPAPPGTKKGYKKAEDQGGRRWGCTANPQEIAADWARWPHANVGIACGPASGLFVVEADTIEGHGVDGVGNLAALIAQRGSLPPTIEALSPSGSRHLYFAWPDGHDVRNSEGRIAPGIDVRGEGGVVIAPPSVKPGHPLPYRWIRPPGVFKLAVCPGWLLQLCVAKEAQRKDAFGPGLRVVTSDADEQVLAWLYTRSNSLCRDDWVRLCLALKGHFGQRARDAWLSFSSRYGGEITSGEAERQWDTAHPDGRVELGTAIHLLGGSERHSRAENGFEQSFDPDGGAGDGPRSSHSSGNHSLHITATPYVWRDPASLPRRPWVYGRQLLRGSVFVLIAPGATGKSALMAGTALCLCTARSLLGHEVWDGAKRVWIWNLEDSLADLQFAIQAAALHWSIAEEDVTGRLFVDSGLDGATLKLAKMGREGPMIDGETSAAIQAEILRRRIDVLIIDPFISSHGLNDENDNAAIDLVAKEWARIATASGCAIVLVHHSKKLNGAEVTAESSRGASALVDAARGGLALNTMTKAEAESFGIDLDQRRRFFRADDAKPNRAPAGTGQWFEMVSVCLGNGADGGDSVGVATPWSAPDPFDNVSTHHLRMVQAKIAEGAWRENIQASDWAGRVVADVLDLDLEIKAGKQKAKKILRTWIDNGALRVIEKLDRNGDPRKFVVVGGVA